MIRSGCAMIRKALLSMLPLALSVLAPAQTAVFPSLKAPNLNGVQVDMPGGFGGDRNLLLIAFKRQQQKDIDTWLKPAAALAQLHASLRYYELPVIDKLNRMARYFIDNGMRGGIPDKQQRARTITLYIDKAPFNAALAITSEDQIHILLIDKTGKVLWRDRGLYDNVKGKALEDTFAPPK